MIFFLSQSQKVSASEVIDLEKISKLEEKVANSYSNKFCNSIGMGISAEGATRLTITENQESKFNPSLWFELVSSGNKNLKEINRDQLAETISTKVVYSCGNALGLSGQQGIDEFKSYFISIRDEIESSK